LFALIQARLSAQVEGDNAILSKKPLGGWSCASCEKNLNNMVSGNGDQQTNWNRMPYRDPAERMAKVGQGFSKMLQMIRPIDVGQSRMTAGDGDTTLLTNIGGGGSTSILMPDIKSPQMLQTSTSQL
jgi:hypothetical protein